MASLSFLSLFLLMEYSAGESPDSQRKRHSLVDECFLSAVASMFPNARGSKESPSSDNLLGVLVSGRNALMFPAGFTEIP